MDPIFPMPSVPEVGSSDEPKELHVPGPLSYPPAWRALQDCYT